MKRNQDPTAQADGIHPEMNRVVVIGSRIAGCLAATWLKEHHPDLEIVLVGKTDKQPPVVGESLTEYSRWLMDEIGLRPILDEKHFPKFGLTFYFKRNLDAADCPDYSVHETPREPPMRGGLINRFTLDVDLLAHARDSGVRVLEGEVTDVDLSVPRCHKVTMRERDGHESTIDANWVIDATGRRRLLAGKLGLKEKPACQRCVFWFRLKDFDPGTLKQLLESNTPSHEFGPYYSAHHFMGRANWTWCIPLPTDNGSTLMSIGMTYRPDLLPRSIRTIEDFLDQASAEHPALANLVDSGTVVDTNQYNNYIYRARQRYSEDGWFLIGDAADTSDALYSTGLVMLSIQITQAAAIIRKGIDGNVTPEFVRDLELAYTTLLESTQNEISDLYEVMHDPYQSHWRVNITVITYFYFMLPTLLAGYHTDQSGARLISFIGRSNRPNIRSLNRLIRAAADRPEAWNEIRNRFDLTVNWAITSADDARVSQDLATLAHRLTRFRFSLLRYGCWKDRLLSVWQCISDTGKAACLTVLFRDRSLKKSTLARVVVNLLLRPSTQTTALRQDLGERAVAAEELNADGKRPVF